MKVYSFIPEKAREKIDFSLFLCFFSTFHEMNKQIPGESAPAAQSSGSFVGKIMIYYTIIIRRNQHLFATFHSKIAKLFNPSARRSHSSRLLLKSYNSLFLDRYPTASGQKHPGNSFLFPSVHQGQTFQILVNFQLKSSHHDGADRCTCNEAGFLLHFAGFLQGSFLFFAPSGSRDSRSTPSLPSEGRWPGAAGSEGWALKV